MCSHFTPPSYIIYMIHHARGNVKRERRDGVVRLSIEWWRWCAPLRGACARNRTFVWMGVVLVGLCVREDLWGVTSLVRALGLEAVCYDRLPDFFHSAALDVDRLTRLWAALVVNLHPQLLRCNGRLVLVGDGLKVGKAGKKMPGVKRLHQSSESNTKPQFILGHSCQADPRKPRLRRVARTTRRVDPRLVVEARRHPGTLCRRPPSHPRTLDSHDHGPRARLPRRHPPLRLPHGRHVPHHPKGPRPVPTPQDRRLPRRRPKETCRLPPLHPSDSLPKASCSRWPPPSPNSYGRPSVPGCAPSGPASSPPKRSSPSPCATPCPIFSPIAPQLPTSRNSSANALIPKTFKLPGSPHDYPNMLYSQRTRYSRYLPSVAAFQASPPLKGDLGGCTILDGGRVHGADTSP